MRPTDPTGCTVTEALALAAGRGLAKADARALLMAATGRSREWLITHDSAQLATEALVRYLDHVDARARGEPVAYLVGMREFHGLALNVDRRVLIPRPETEALVAFACDRAPRDGHVLDLGTGSGAIAIADARPDLHLLATDVSSDALAVAQANAARLVPGRIDFRLGDWFASTTRCVDVVVANPPYVAPRDPHLDAGDLRFEPRGALTDGVDGLAALRTIVRGAPARLSGHGWCAVEHGWDQAEAVRALFVEAGFEAVATERDLAGHERITFGRLPR